jgi:hypothetical protein
MICILCESITPRHEFVFKVIFELWLKIPYKIISNKEDFDNTKDILISYSNKNPKTGIWISPSGLLNENSIINKVPSVTFHENIPVLFSSIENNTTLPCDIFSAIFWMISRYEEYLPFVADEHGRFGISQSLTYRSGFYYMPVVDYWVSQLSDSIRKFYPDFQVPANSFRFIPTYDIDQAWAYLHKGYLRNTGALVKKIFSGQYKNASEHMKVLLRKVPDPFDSYSFQFELQAKYKLKPIYFIHPGTYGRFDKNISLKNKYFRNLINDLSAKGEIGLHPSYRSATEPGLIEKEKHQLEEACGLKINKCRYHFLRLSYPESYRDLISCGITDDYSLGWVEDIGFRAGTSREFPFYDLEKEQITLLAIHPFIMMEGALGTHRHLNAEESLREIIAQIDIVKANGGDYICLWHNEILGSSAKWAGWRTVFEEMIREALKSNTHD